MSTLSKPQANGNATEARLRPEDTTSRIDKVLQHLDVVPSKAEQHVFRYAYLYFLGFLLLLILLDIVGGVLLGYSKHYSNYLPTVDRIGKYHLLAVVGLSLILWTFNVWREHISRILRDVFEKRRIYMPAGDINAHYLGFLEQYRAALRSPSRYLLIGSLMLIMAIELIVFPAGAVNITKSVLTSSQRIADPIFWGIYCLLVFLIDLGFMVSSQFFGVHSPGLKSMERVYYQHVRRFRSQYHSGRSSAPSGHISDELGGNAARQSSRASRRNSASARREQSA